MPSRRLTPATFAGLLLVLAACAGGSSPGAEPTLVTLGPVGSSEAMDGVRASSGAVQLTAPPGGMSAAGDPTSTTSTSVTSNPTTGTSPAATSSAATPPATVEVVAAPVATQPQTGTPCVGANASVSTTSGREVLIRAPAADRTAPLILLLHGYTGSPTGIERYADLSARANASGVVVAYPQGTPTVSDGYGWNSGAGIFATSSVDDVAALDEMIDAVLATGCVDPARMVLTGESNGAGMVLAATCSGRMRHRFIRVVMVIPAVDPGVVARCDGDVAPVPLTAVAGRADQTVPYDGGRPPLLGQREWFDSAVGIVNGCVGVTDTDAIDAHVARRVGNGCAACSELLTIDDGTHTWPGSSRGVGGLRPGTFDLNGPLIAAALDGSTGCLGGG